MLVLLKHNDMKFFFSGHLCIHPVKMVSLCIHLDKMVILTGHYFEP